MDFNYLKSVFDRAANNAPKEIHAPRDFFKDIEMPVHEPIIPPPIQPHIFHGIPVHEHENEDLKALAVLKAMEGQSVIVIYKDEDGTHRAIKSTDLMKHLRNESIIINPDDIETSQDDAEGGCDE